MIKSFASNRCLKCSTERYSTFLYHRYYKLSLSYLIVSNRMQLISNSNLHTVVPLNQQQNQAHLNGRIRVVQNLEKHNSVAYVKSDFHFSNQRVDSYVLVTFRQPPPLLFAPFSISCRSVGFIKHSSRNYNKNLPCQRIYEAHEWWLVIVGIYFDFVGQGMSAFLQ